MSNPPIGFRHGSPDNAEPKAKKAEIKALKNFLTK
jgi:hypothetical protein